MGSKPAHILLIEDDEIDAESMRRALKKLKINSPLTHVKKGIEALEFLRADGARYHEKSPYLIVLDINMPTMNGFEFLEELRRDDNHKNAIVFVLSTSNAERDKIRAYKDSVEGYLLKSIAGKGFMDVVEMLEQYWRFVNLSSRSALPNSMA